MDLGSHPACLNFMTRACTGYPVSNYFYLMPFNSVSPICKSPTLALTSTHVACSVRRNIFVLTFRSKEIKSAKVCCFYVRCCHVRSCFSRLIQFSILLQFLSSVVISDPFSVKFPAVCECQTHHLVFLARADVASQPSLSPCQICFALVWDFTRLSLYSWRMCHYWSVLWPGFRLPILDTFAIWTINELFVSFTTCILLKPLFSVSYSVNLHFVPSSFKSRVSKKCLQTAMEISSRQISKYISEKRFCDMKKAPLIVAFFILININYSSRLYI